MFGCGRGCTALHGSAQERRGGVSRHSRGPLLGRPCPAPGRWDLVDLDLRRFIDMSGTVDVRPVSQSGQSGQ